MESSRRYAKLEPPLSEESELEARSGEPPGPHEIAQQGLGNQAVERQQASRTQLTVGVDAYEVEGEKAVYFVNGHPVSIASDGEARTADDKDPLSSPGPIRFVVTRDVANCVVFAQRGQRDGMTVIHFAHLSSRKYEAMGHDDPYTTQVREFGASHAGAEEIEGTNSGSALVGKSVRKSGLPSANFHSTRGRGYLPFVLDLESFKLYPANRDYNHTYSFGRSDITTYHSAFENPRKKKKHWWQLWKKG